MYKFKKVRAKNTEMMATRQVQPVTTSAGLPKRAAPKNLTFRALIMRPRRKSGGEAK